MLHHYVKFLTPSEFFTFLVGSHSSIAGFAFGIIILFGVSYIFNIDEIRTYIVVYFQVKSDHVLLLSSGKIREFSVVTFCINHLRLLMVKSGHY